MKDLYSVLGVSKSASAEEIKRAYRKLTRELHPDKNPGDKAAEERFKDVSTAYDVLGDTDKRALYDEFGEVSLTQGFDPARARAYKQAQRGFGGGFGGPGAGPGGFSFNDFGEARETSFDDLLSRLFGGGRVRADFGGAAPRARKGANVVGEIKVSFMDALFGSTVPLRIEGENGEGKTLDVKVPPGVSDGAKLRLRGQGGAGDPPGDVLLTIKVGSHRHLKRDGQNLRMDLPVTAFEAYQGGPIDVPTPWGTVVLKLPPGSQSGQTLRIRGKGVHGSKGDGDLLVTLSVVLPKPGDEALVDALERLQSAEHPRQELSL